MKEKLKRIFVSKHPRSPRFSITQVLSAFAVLAFCIISFQAVSKMPFFNSLSLNILIIGYAIILTVILLVGFTVASFLNFKDNAEYFAAPGKKRDFLIANLMPPVIVMIIITVINLY